MPLEFRHRFIPSPNASAPTILLMHEEGADENDLLPVGRALAPGTNLLSPKLSSDTSPADLAEWIGRERGLVYALGYASGATLAARIMLTRPGTLAGGVLLRPDPVTTPDPLPDLSGVKILCIGGDPQLAAVLARAGADVDVAMPDADPQLTPHDFSLGQRWFAETLS